MLASQVLTLSYPPLLTNRGCMEPVFYEAVGGGGAGIAGGVGKALPERTIESVSELEKLFCELARLKVSQPLSPSSSPHHPCRRMLKNTYLLTWRQQTNTHRLV